MKRIVFLLSWLGTLSYMGLIFYLSSLPTIEQIPAIPHIDKVLHLGAYGLMAMLWVESLLRSGVSTQKKLVLLALCICSLYGISDEFHQSFVPGREVSVLDWIADTIGAILGAWFWVKWRTRAKTVNI